MKSLEMKFKSADFRYILSFFVYKFGHKNSNIQISKWNNYFNYFVGIKVNKLTKNYYFLGKKRNDDRSAQHFVPILSYEFVSVFLYQKYFFHHLWFFKLKEFGHILWMCPNVNHCFKLVGLL